MYSEIAKNAKTLLIMVATLSLISFSAPEKILQYPQPAGEVLVDMLKDIELYTGEPVNDDCSNFPQLHWIALSKLSAKVDFSNYTANVAFNNFLADLASNSTARALVVWSLVAGDEKGDFVFIPMPANLYETGIVVPDMLVGEDGFYLNLSEDCPIPKLYEIGNKETDAGCQCRLYGACKPFYCAECIPVASYKELVHERYCSDPRLINPMPLDTFSAGSILLN